VALKQDNKKRASSLTVAAVANPVEVNRGFEEMVAGTTRKYYMLGGKGGVGKTSLAASLAVKFANSGHPTLVVSTDPAHSLSDSFAQDLGGGTIMPVDGVDLPLYAMEINPEQAREEFRASVSKDGGTGVKDFMDSVGLGGWVGELSELKLGELLDTPPPGLDEAMAISKVVQFMQAPEYSKFTRIIFDTAPTGHTLRLLSLPDFLDASIGKILKLKKKIQSAASAIKSVFGQGDGPDKATDKLEALKERMIMVREIFRNKETTEFVIVTIPTVMAISESSRLKSSLEKEGVPVKRLIVNQVLPPSNVDCKFCAVKRKDQKRAMDMVANDVNLKTLEIVQSPLFDLEIRGVPALKFMGDLVWR
jgi:arsenite-transporting ATPase